MGTISPRITSYNVCYTKLLRFVDPAYFGKGVGSSLLSHAVSVLGADRVDVNEQNERALGFYERHGFVVTGRSQVDGTGRPYPLLHMTLRDQDRSGPAPTPSRNNFV